MSADTPTQGHRGMRQKISTWSHELNTGWHRRALLVFLAIVIAHWVEHLAQAFQIWVLGWPRPQSLGLVGWMAPWLFTSETLHYGFAIVMLVGLVLLRPGFTGRARQWWDLALAIQFWHHFEHLLLLVQAASGWRLGGGAAPSSVLQLVVPRVELHLFYNAVVFAPMVVAMVLHLRPRPGAQPDACGCAPAHRRQVQVAAPA